MYRLAIGCTRFRYVRKSCYSGIILPSFYSLWFGAFTVSCRMTVNSTSEKGRSRLSDIIFGRFLIPCVSNSNSFLIFSLSNSNNRLFLPIGCFCYFSDKKLNSIGIIPIISGCKDAVAAYTQQNNIIFAKAVIHVPNKAIATDIDCKAASSQPPTPPRALPKYNLEALQPNHKKNISLAYTASNGLQVGLSKRTLKSIG